MGKQINKIKKLNKDDRLYLKEHGNFGLNPITFNGITTEEYLKYYKK